MVRLLFERVYVDLEGRLITAIVPTAEFGFLLQHALEAAERSDIMLVPVEDVEAALRPPSAGVLEMVETGEN